MSELTAPVQAFVAADGTVFTGPDAKQKAIDHMRLPLITSAFMTLAKGNKEMTEYLIANEDEVVSAFETGTIKLVTKKERQPLEDALKKVVEVANPDFKFINDHSEAILESFRWPTVKRMSEEEKALAARNSLMALTNGNVELVDWILANKEGVMEAYEAGKVKRAVSDAGIKALEEYRAKKAAEKAALAAAE